MNGVQMVDTATIPVEGGGVYKQSADVVCREVGLESILVPIRHNVGNLDFVYTLSPVAARIWALLDGARSVDEVIDALCAEYDTDRETATADVAAFLADLGEASLIARAS